VDKKDTRQKRQNKMPEYEKYRKVLGQLKRKKLDFSKRQSVSKILRPRDAKKSFPQTE